MNNLETIKALLRRHIEIAEAATPGPWGCNITANPNESFLRGGPDCGSDAIRVLLKTPDAAFIANNRTLSPAMARALLVAIEGLEYIRTNCNPCNEASAWSHESLETICHELSEDVK